MKVPRPRGLRGRLILLLLTAFAALAGLLTWHLLQDRDERVKAAMAELLGRTRMMAARQGALVERADALLNALSALPAPTDLASAAACSQLLAERLKQEPAFSQIARTRPDGEGICSAVPFTGNRNIFDRPYFQRTLQVRGTVVSDVVIGRTLGKPIVVFARAVRDTQDRVSGVLFASLGLDWLERELAEAQLPQGARLAVLDDQGRISLRYPDPDAWTGKRAADNPVVRQVLAADGEGTLEELGLDGKRLLAAHSPFLVTASGARYHLVLAVPKQVIEAPARRDALAGLGVMLAVLLATLAWVIVGGNRLLLQPLSTLARTAIRLKAGDLGARSGLPHGDDEIGRLAATLDETAAAIEDRDTRRKQAEQALRASEERFAKAFQLSPDACTISRIADQRIFEANEAWRTLCGFGSDEEVLGRTAQELGILPQQEDRERVVSRLRAEGCVRDFEMVIRRKSGELRQVSATATIIVLGGEACLMSIMRDITERKHAEQRIRQQLEHLSLLDQITRSTGERLDLKSIFQIVLNQLEDSLPVDFGCVGLYDPAAKTLQVSCVGARSQALACELSLQEPATIDIDENGLSRCVQGHLVYEPDIGQLLRYPFPARLARGGLASLVLAPLKSESRVFGVLVVARHQAQAFSSTECEFLRQLSEHVALAAHQAQLYGALQQAYEDLRQTQQAAMQEERLRALGQMASGIAHDINNALSPVSLYVESMLETERNLSERARGYLKTIERAVDDVAQTVARMREFYRQREPQLVLTPVDVNHLVQQVLDLTRARWSDMPLQRGIVIQAVTELAPGLPKIMGVESEIREALTNLVFNAIDAMPEGGRLTLRTRLAGAEPEQSVVIEVIDTGLGMDEDTRQRCLEPFFTTKGERGTGLGLAMVFGMVQRHSAEIEIDSAPGAGTTVRLVFAVPASVQAEPGRPAALQVPARLRLLLIDDDPVLLKSLQDTLQADGHLVATASGGEAGVAAFGAALGRGEAFAAVITDLGMPYLDGRRVALAVKQASPATPVILLTGWGQRLVTEGDVPPCVDRVLAKPPKLRELREALGQLCRPASEAGA